MSLTTTITRAWITRSFKPFSFQNEYDDFLPFEECENLGLYVHIPFCKSICNFCPYCKTFYRKEQCDRYIDALIKEIHKVGGQYKRKKETTSLYFGGGTPALIADRVGEIIAAINEHFVITEGIGVELHPDNVNVETLQKLRAAGVTKISIGIQSFLEKHETLLGRKQVDALQLKEILAAVEFETVSMDFIFALPHQTYEDLKTDVDTAFMSGANHVAIYPFIDFSFTQSNVKSMPRKQKKELLDRITTYFHQKGYHRSSIWTFSNKKEAQYSSMTRDNFLGFGCSATSLLKKQFKINTFSVDEYCKRMDSDELPTSLTIRFTERQRMVYYLFWTLYSMQLDEKKFEQFFGIPLGKKYGFEFWLAQRLGLLTKENGIYSMTMKGAFYYHYYEQFYTLSYIDKMWGIMRKEAFPERIEL
ncbi:MAG: radical SAM protein [Bacteroidales bacterium]|nr:radical SAM protein [Bacteroidales bacterium]